MEDLGTGRELLGDLVEGTDPDVATAGLIAFNRALGTLNGSTIGRDAEYRRLPVRGDSSATSRHVVHRTKDTLSRLPDLLEEQQISAGASFYEALASMQREIATPGPFHGFVHGDAAIGNVFYDAERGDVRLIDFESGAFRHVLLDGSYARLRYILSVWARRMPLDLQRALLHEYRNELGKWCPAALDDRLFNQGLLACSAFWMTAILTTLPQVITRDRQARTFNRTSAHRCRT